MHSITSTAQDTLPSIQRHPEAARRHSPTHTADLGRAARFTQQPAPREAHRRPSGGSGAEARGRQAERPGRVPRPEAARLHSPTHTPDLGRAARFSTPPPSRPPHVTLTSLHRIPLLTPTMPKDGPYDTPDDPSYHPRTKLQQNRPLFTGPERTRITTIYLDKYTTSLIHCCNRKEVNTPWQNPTSSSAFASAEPRNKCYTRKLLD